jgi:hypothetical protein
MKTKARPYSDHENAVIMAAYERGEPLRTILHELDNRTLPQVQQQVKRLISRGRLSKRGKNPARVAIMRASDPPPLSDQTTQVTVSTLSADPPHTITAPTPPACELSGIPFTDVLPPTPLTLTDPTTGTSVTFTVIPYVARMLTLDNDASPALVLRLLRRLLDYGVLTPFLFPVVPTSVPASIHLPPGATHG